jgi:hypothetical protein
VRYTKLARIVRNLVDENGRPLNLAQLFDSSGNPILSQTPLPGGAAGAWIEQTFTDVTSAAINVDPSWDEIELELDGAMGPEFGDWQARLRLNNLNSGYSGTSTETWHEGTQPVPGGVGSGAPLVRTGYGTPGDVDAQAILTKQPGGGWHISSTSHFQHPQPHLFTDQVTEVDHPTTDPLQLVVVDFGGTRFTGTIRVREVVS